MARVSITNRLPRKGASFAPVARLAKETDSEYLERLISVLDDRLDEIVRAINATDASIGGGNAPINATYLVETANGVLTSERVVTDTATVTWDFATPGQVKATAIGGTGLSHPQVLARTLGA